MSSEKDDKGKKRADKYDEKVTFDGTFEDMVKISVKDAEKRVKERKATDTDGEVKKTKTNE